MTVAESASGVQGVMTFGPTKTHQRRVVVLPLVVEPLPEHLGTREPDARVFTAPGGGVPLAGPVRTLLRTPAAAASVVSLPTKHARALDQG